MFFRIRPQHRRRLVGLMLVVWLFAVMNSTVHACAVMGHGHADAARVVLEAAHDGGASPAPVPCEGGCRKFCKDESATLTKADSQPGMNPAALLLIPGSTVLPGAGAGLAPMRAPLRAPAHGPPVFLRYARLTL